MPHIKKKYLYLYFVIFLRNNSSFMKKEFIFSPNFSTYSRSAKAYKFIIIHYTGMQSEIASIKKLIDPRSKSSCHYLINKKVKLYN